MTNTDDFLAGLNPKVAKALKKAEEVKTEKLPLASQTLTDALGGGIGKGRVFLLYGNTSAGKSTLMMESARDWQNMGEVVVYVDSEKTWDNEWAKRLGLDTSNLIVIQQKSISRVYNEIKPLLENNVGAVILDSISMMTPDSFLDDEGNAKDLEGHKQIGAHAKAITSLTNAIHYSNENTAVTLISQTTTEIGQTYTKQVPHGGKKLPFAASQIVKLTSSNTDNKKIKKKVKVGDKLIDLSVGRGVDGVVEKNKLGPEGETCKYDLYFRGDFVGIDKASEVLRDAVKYGVIKKGGAWFTVKDKQLQGEENAIEYVRDNPDLMNELIALTSEIKNG